jgi:hypothetical protein
MTDPLDEVYDRPSVVYYPVTVSATWPELEPGYSSLAGLGVPGSITQIGQQIGPDGFNLTHSMDDGLPDAVTSTGTFEASASFRLDLTGRQGQTAAPGSLALGANSTTGTGTGTSFTTTYPSGLAFWDYVFVAITVQNASEVTETSMPVTSFQAWRLLGDSINVVGGTTYRTWVFGRKHYTSGVVAPSFKIDVSANYGWVIGSIVCPKTAGWNALVGVTPGDIEIATETVSQTAHAQTPVTVENRGWTIGAFGSGSGAGTWSSTGNTILGQTSGGNIALALVASPLRPAQGDYSLSASTSVATQGVAMVHIGMEIRDYPNMSAGGYFSPLNSQSPIADFERDTAPLSLAINNIRTDGNGFLSTVVYRGQMAGIEINGDRATLTGVSKTRLLLDNSKLLPTVNGRREGLTTDWLAGLLLANGGQYTGVAPTVYTRYWAPSHGSMHPYMDGSAGYPGSYALRPEWGADNYHGNQPTSVDGPFVTAMYGEQKSTSIIENQWVADRNWATEVPGIQSPVLTDLITQKNSVGRFSCWIRGDAFEAAPSALLADSNDHHPVQIYLWNEDSSGNIINYIHFLILSNRGPSIRMSSDPVNLAGGPLPTDGNWHFVAFQWDYDNGVAKARMDSTGWATVHAAAASETLPNSESALKAVGGFTKFQITSRLPIAEIQLEAGIDYADNFTRLYPTQATPSKNATYRPTRQPLSAIAIPTPVQGWSTLQSLAQSTLSHFRVNESDNAEFLPLSYFGESALMTVETLNVLNTEFNAGAIGLNVDATKTRNVVTTQFTDTRVASTRSSILELTTAIGIPSGVTRVTFTLDVPTAETHGGAQYWNTASTFQKLTASHISGATPLPNENIMSVNTNEDGSGTVFVSGSFSARVVDWSSNAVTIEFTNSYSATLYLSNNGAQIPFLRVLGYPILTGDGYSTVSDPGNVTASRRERALTTSVDWIHDRTTAEQFGGTLVGLLSQPTQEVVVTVVGDPRRVPGRLCQLVDSTGTRASGTWRINQVVHRGNGPMYVQDLSLVRVGDFGNWDESDWDELVWDD